MMTSALTGLFDRSALQAKRARAAGLLPDARFLLDHTGANLLSRLDDIKRSFPITVQLGARDSGDFSAKAKRMAGADLYVRSDITPALLNTGSVCAGEEFLPFKAHSLDLILSNLSLHATNDLPGVLIQARHALRPDGLFLAAMLGGETLHELRTSLMQAEIKVTGGASARIMPFADKPQMGDLMQRAGFSLPVIDSDIVTVSYETMFKLMHDLRAMGEASIIADRAKNCMRRDVLMEAEAYYHAHFGEGGGRIRASFEVIYLIGWAPDASQQQPLKPGSAQTRLADALNTKESKLL